MDRHEKWVDRGTYINWLRQRLERSDLPRLKMMLIMAVTGAVGFLASYVLLSMGVLSMPWRYFWSVTVSYMAFLGLLAVWLRIKLSDVDVPDPFWLDSGSSGASQEGVCEMPIQPGGGQFGGAGADANIDYPGSSMMKSTNPGPDISGKIDGVLDADELWVFVIIIASILASVLASAWVVYEAPSLVAELIFDGVVVTGIYRRLRQTDQTHWFRTALRRTALPFVVILLSFIGAGLAMQSYAPGATTAGEVWKYTSKTI